jgi:hypothetical protein
MIVLSSFFRKPDGLPAFSVARYQPKGFHLPELRLLAPMDRYGVKLKGFIDHREYRKLYKAALKDRKEAVLNWLDSLRPNKHFVLCCWCTIEQQRRKGYDTVMCHTILLGKTIIKHRPDILVFVDRDRYLYSAWPHNFRLYDPTRRKRHGKARQLT